MVGQTPYLFLNGKSFSGVLEADYFENALKGKRGYDLVEILLTDGTNNGTLTSSNLLLGSFSLVRKACETNLQIGEAVGATVAFTVLENTVTDNTTKNLLQTGNYVTLVFADKSFLDEMDLLKYAASKSYLVKMRITEVNAKNGLIKTEAIGACGYAFEERVAVDTFANISSLTVNGLLSEICTRAGVTWVTEDRAVYDGCMYYNVTGLTYSTDDGYITLKDVLMDICELCSMNCIDALAYENALATEGNTGGYDTTKPTVRFVRPFFEERTGISSDIEMNFNSSSPLSDARIFQKNTALQFEISGCEVVNGEKSSSIYPIQPNPTSSARKIDCQKNGTAKFYVEAVNPGTGLTSIALDSGGVYRTDLFCTGYEFSFETVSYGYAEPFDRFQNSDYFITGVEYRGTHERTIIECVAPQGVLTATSGSTRNNTAQTTYTKSEVDTALRGKSDTGHTHAIADVSGISLNTTASEIKMNGTQSAGSGTAVAKANHVHPVDTSRAAASHAHAVGDITGVLPVANGGTGCSTIRNAAYAMINGLATGSSAIGDNDYFVAQYHNGGTSDTRYFRKPFSLLRSYIEDNHAEYSFSSSVGGYYKTASGLIIQWGNYGASSTGLQTITLPTSFTAQSSYIVLATPQYQNNNNYKIYARPYSATQFYLNVLNIGESISWFAIGI